MLKIHTNSADKQLEITKLSNTVEYKNQVLETVFLATKMCKWLLKQD